MERRPHYSHLWFLALLCTVVCWTPFAAGATEVRWTANEDDSAEGNSGPLPLSMKQRQQLLQLEEVIRSSPNPEETLKKTADANGMSPQDLASMLQRNRSDLEQGVATSSTSGTIVGAVGKLLATVFAILTKWASQHPKAFAMFTTLLFLLGFLAVSAPRTGLELSRRRGLLSRGPTTLLPPPTKFLERRLGSTAWQERNTNDKTIHWRGLQLEEDGTVWHSLPRKSELVKAATAQITIPIDLFLDEDDEEDAAGEALELCFHHAVDLLAATKLTEYAPQSAVRLHILQDNSIPGRRKLAVLAVKSIGDWGRWGMVPLLLTSQQENDVEASVTFSALKAAPFSGQIHLSVAKRSEGPNGSIVLQVHLAVPRGGIQLSKRGSLKIVESLATSLALSVKTRTRQSLVRRTQSSRFQGTARVRAEERRHSRHEKEKQIEEMAEDRRRRWQRNNPDAGRYRPSGNMMKSPNNVIP